MPQIMGNPRTARALAGLLSLLAGCGGGAMSGGGPGSLASPGREAERCPDSSEGSEQLSVAWRPEERADAELLARDGVVVVHQRGCDFRVLRDCRLRGSYVFTAMPPKTEELTITNQGELENLMPFHARELASRVEQPGGLVVRAVLVGRRVAAVSRTSASDLQGDCSGATHFVASMTLGAFQLEAGADAHQSESPLAGGPSERRVLSSAGDGSACREASAEAAKPPTACSEMVRISLSPLGTPGAAPDPAPASDSPSTAASSGFSEGSLLKGSGPEIFLIEDGKRRHVPDPHTFDAMGLEWGKVRTLSDDELSRVPLGEPLPKR